MKNLLHALLFLISLDVTANLGVTEDFIKRFSSLPSYTDVDISPDGKMISVITKMPDDKKGLTIFDAENLSLINTISLTNEEEVASYFWANSTRLVIQVGYYDKKMGVAQLASTFLLTLILLNQHIYSV